MKRLLALGVLALAVSASPAYAILNGEPDGDAHPYVGLVTNQPFVAPGTAGLCTGTKISSHRILTAAHCFPPGAPFGSPTVTIFPGPLGTPPQVVFGLFVPHDGWCAGCSGGLPGADTNDVAIVVVPGGMSPPYASLAPMGSVDRLPMRQEVTSVGFGIRVRLKDFAGEVGLRYKATSEIVQAPSRVSDEYVKLSANPGQGKGGTCFGDSGGPSLIGDMIIGITAFGANSNCAGVTYAQRIDILQTRSFIDEFPS